MDVKGNIDETSGTEIDIVGVAIEEYAEDVTIPDGVVDVEISELVPLCRESKIRLERDGAGVMTELVVFSKMN